MISSTANLGCSIKYMKLFEIGNSFLPSSAVPPSAVGPGLVPSTTTGADVETAAASITIGAAAAVVVVDVMAVSMAVHLALTMALDRVTSKS
ncbi:unnamed protein product [Hydatigera taeniaeformis]|uniref:Uncharacterized protein n=1 Tax=Hydatigena taeniaeformis TaxID=6205 RepID=A0A0R3X689_HYDTA|nr:unnamed protein product [Hydatigera taeniaeformis]